MKIAKFSDLFGRIEPARQCDTGGDSAARVMARLRPMIDLTIAKLANVQFREDPISGIRYSKLHSILGSAQKRHGHILEMAIRESLRDSNRYHLWVEPQFAVSGAAQSLANSQTYEDCCQSELPYGDRTRSIQIDLGIFDDADHSIGAYEIKRGNGRHDAGKVRSVIVDLSCTQMLLKSYGRTLGFAPASAAAKIIFYYGERSIAAPLSLIGTELDDHFGFPIIERVEKVNEYFQAQLHAILENLK